MRDRSGWGFWLGIVAIAAFGVLQACADLARGLALDEPFVANMVHLGWSQMVEMVWRSETPLYHILLKGWTCLFGESEIALRSFSVLCFALAVAAVGYTAKRLGGAGAGYLAAFLMSVSPVGLQHAATARMYALLGLQVAVAGLLCFRLLALSDRAAPASGAGRWILLCVLLTGVNLAGLLNHSTYLLFMGACNLAALLASRRTFLALTVCNLLSVALHLGLWGPALVQLLQSPATAWMKVPTFGDLRWALFTLWGKGGTLLLAAYLLAFSLVSWRGAKRFWLSRQGLVCSTLLVALILLPFAVSQFKPVFYPVRTPALFLPAACLTAALLMAHLGHPRLAAGVLLLLAFSSVRTMAAPPLEPGARSARASVERVVEKARCGDTVISIGHALNEVGYYLRRLDTEGCLQHVVFPSSMAEHPGWADFADLLGRPGALAEEAELLVDQLLTSRPTGAVWLFYDTVPPQKDVGDYVKGQLDRRMVLVETLDLDGSFFRSILAYSPTGE